jgi:hypothetical protein
MRGIIKGFRVAFLIGITSAQAGDAPDIKVAVKDDGKTCVVAGRETSCA